jgi:hypothetical protein
MQDQIAPPGFKYVTSFDPILKANLQRLVKLDVADSTSWRLNLETLGDLVALVSAECNDVDIRKIEASGDLYQYDSSSELTPDGYTVIAPTDMPRQGRWIRQQSSGGGSVDQQEYLLNFSESDWSSEEDGWLLQRPHNISFGSQAPKTVLYENLGGSFRLLVLYDLEVTAKDFLLRANQKFAGRLEISVLSSPISPS